MSFRIKKIKNSQRSVGLSLKRARAKKGVSLPEVEEITAIRIKYLEALEQDNFADLPASVYSIGFLRRYATFLALKPDPLLHQFKTDLAIWQAKHVGTLSPIKSIKEPKLFITPKLVGGTIGVLCLMSLVSYIWYEIRFVTAPPMLVINTPVENFTTADAQVAISGQTDKSIQLTINDQLITQDGDGNFAQQVALLDGVNTISIVAQNRFDKQTIKTVKILKTSPTNQNNNQT